MKIHIDIDCTPEEARRFLGLPDVSEVNHMAMDKVRQRLKKTLEEMDPETMLRTWLPAGLEGWRQMQDVFWQEVTKAAGGRAGGEGGKGGEGDKGGKGGKGGGGGAE